MLTPDDLLARLDVGAHVTDAATTGIRAIDEPTGGVARGQVWVLTGWPGQGRSAFLVQLAARLAVTHGWETTLACPRLPDRHVAARLVAHLGPTSLPGLLRGETVDEHRIDRARDALRGSPLRVFSRTDRHPLTTDEIDRSPPAALLLDDGHTSAGVFPQRLQSLAGAEAFVAVTLPKHLVVCHDTAGPYLQHDWADVADVVLEIRQAAWPADPAPLRPGEVDITILKNSLGPAYTGPIVFHPHLARFKDPAPG
jgi:replicative DNA helicase